ncbi:hypothetical protein GCM10009000_079400 [Halobacterium noricense]|uniref:Transposase DDE domain-containing protein n=1 Tax=Haladaptatus pallidirubidus TaxID=1008152 RepID=A0AAV3UNY1_9EURY
MYHQSLDRLLERVADTKEFHRAGIVAIDITEANPFTGDRSGYENEIIGTKEASDEYAYQWATVQLVGNAVPLVLDARPVRKGENRLEIVEDLLDSAEELVFVDNVLMDREFDSQHVLDAISKRGLTYVVPKRMQTSDKAQAKRLCQRDQNRYVTDRNLHLGSNEWHNTTLIYRRKEDAEYTDHRQYSVFMSNGGEISQRVRVSLGDRTWLSEYQAVHGRNNVEELRLTVFLLRVCLSVVLDLASGRFACASRVNRRVRAFAGDNGRQYAHATEEGDGNRVESYSVRPHIAFPSGDTGSSFEKLLK